MESRGQRRRCRRGPWWHGARGGFGRFGCHARGRWCTAPPPPWCRDQPAATAATAASQQPPAGGAQPANNSATQADPHCDRDTNVETGEMTTGQCEATATATDQEWTLVNDGIADVESAATAVEQLHMSPRQADISAAGTAGTYKSCVTLLAAVCTFDQ